MIMIKSYDCGCLLFGKKCTTKLYILYKMNFSIQTCHRRELNYPTSEWCYCLRMVESGDS